LAESRVTCSECGVSLDESYAQVPRKPCPECGSTARTYSQKLVGTVNVTGWIDWEHTHEAWEKNRPLVAIAAVLTVASTLVGYLVAGLVGVGIGLAISIAAWVISARAIVWVREKERGSTRPQ
jgi:hypothetical protein